jgi:hypothetical protein
MSLPIENSLCLISPFSVKYSPKEMDVIGSVWPYLLAKKYHLSILSSNKGFSMPYLKRVTECDSS